MLKLKKNANNAKRTRVTCVQCPECNYIIYSRARHDYRPCPCGTVAIDGGFDYVKIMFTGTCPDTFNKYVRATRAELYDDWNTCTDKFGVIRHAR